MMNFYSFFCMDCVYLNYVESYICAETAATNICLLVRGKILGSTGEFNAVYGLLFTVFCIVCMVLYCRRCIHAWYFCME